jgi:hypothetical protein
MALTNAEKQARWRERKWSATTKASARRLDYLDGSIMGGILGRTLSHDVEHAWGFDSPGSSAMPASKYRASSGLGSNQNYAGNIAGTISGLSSGLFAPSSGLLFLFTPKTGI